MAHIHPVGYQIGCDFGPWQLKRIMTNMLIACVHSIKYLCIRVIVNMFASNWCYAQSLLYKTADVLHYYKEVTNSMYITLVLDTQFSGIYQLEGEWKSCQRFACDAVVFFRAKSCPLPEEDRHITVKILARFSSTSSWYLRTVYSTCFISQLRSPHFNISAATYIRFWQVLYDHLLSTII